MLHTAFTPYEEFLVEYVRNPGRNDMKVQHYHDTYEFYLQMAGERTLILNDICYTLRPGDLYILFIIPKAAVRIIMNVMSSTFQLLFFIPF